MTIFNFCSVTTILIALTSLLGFWILSVLYSMALGQMDECLNPRAPGVGGEGRGTRSGVIGHFQLPFDVTLPIATTHNIKRVASSQ